MNTRCLPALLCLTAIASCARADGVPIDPRVVLDTCAEAYRTEARTEDVRITVEDTTEKRTERLTVRTQPGRGARVDLGPLVIWTDLESWYAVHADVPDAYMRVPIKGGDPLATLESSVPRALAPQVPWMLGRDAGSWLAGPVGGVSWESASVGEDGSARVLGRAAGASIEVRAQTTGPERIGPRSVVVEWENGPTLTASFLPSGAPRLERLATDVSGRDRVDTLGALLLLVPTED